MGSRLRVMSDRYEGKPFLRRWSSRPMSLARSVVCGNAPWPKPAISEAPSNPRSDTEVPNNAGHW